MAMPSEFITHHPLPMNCVCGGRPPDEQEGGGMDAESAAEHGCEVPRNAGFISPDRRSGVRRMRLFLGRRQAELRN